MHISVLAQRLTLCPFFVGVLQQGSLSKKMQEGNGVKIRLILLVRVIASMKKRLLNGAYSIQGIFSEVFILKNRHVMLLAGTTGAGFANSNLQILIVFCASAIFMHRSRFAGRCPAYT